MSTFHQSHFRRNLQVKCHTPESAQNADTHCVRACAVEIPVNASQEPLYAEVHRTNAGAQSEHPDQAPLHTYRKNPSVWTHCLGNKKEAKTGTAKSKLGNQETTTPGN